MSKVQTAPSTEVSSAPSAFGNALSGLLSRRSDACEHDVAVRKSLPTVDKELRAKRKERKLKKLLRLKEHAPVTDYEADGALERILIRTATKGGNRQCCLCVTCDANCQYSCSGYFI